MSSSLSAALPLPITLADLRRAWARHGRKALAAGAALVAVAFLGALNVPRAYISEAKLLVRPGRENMMLDPTATTGQTISVYESRENEINSLLEVLGSRAVIEQVATRVGPRAILAGRLPGDAPSGWRLPGWGNSAQQPEPTVPDSRLLEQAVQQLDRSLEIWAPRKTAIISIRCKGPDPRLVQKIVATFLEVYQDEHMRVNRVEGSLEFFVTQAATLEQKWHGAVELLRQAKDALGITSLDGQRKLLQDQMAEVEARQLANRAELAASEAKIESLTRLIDELPATVRTQEQESANQAADGMRQSLYQLQIQERELSSKLTAEHPRMQALREQVREVEAILARQEPIRMQATTAVNPSRQALEINLLSEQSQAESLRARAESLDRLREQAVLELKQLNEQEIQLAELQRNVDLAETAYRSCADKREQARLNHELDEERISNVKLVQPATYSSKAHGPSRMLVLACGGVFAVLTSAGVLLAAAWLDPVLKTGAELEAQLGLPLIACLPAA